MPTHKPSPYRFLTSHAPPAQKPKPKTQSGLRNALQTPKAQVAYQEPETEFKRITPAKRFVFPAVRHGKSNSTSAIEPSSNIQATPRPTVPRKLGRVESIEFSSQSSLVATQDEQNTSPILPSIEHVEPMFRPDDEEDAEQAEQDSDEEEMLFDITPHKRRRLSSLTPQTPAPTHNPTTHRFKLATVQTPASLSHVMTEVSSPTVQTSVIRPQFILPPPPTSPVKPSKPLPEIFSPSRKHGKYLPNGMASTMTSWIIEMANTVPDRRSSVYHSNNKEDGIKIRLKIHTVTCGNQDEGSQVDCYSGGITFVKGVTEPGLYNASRSGNEHGEMSVLLAGTGSTRSRECVRLRIGYMVGIRAPLWDVYVGDQKWMVGVDWVVL